MYPLRRDRLCGLGVKTTGSEVTGSMGLEQGTIRLVMKIEELLGLENQK
jgi:hypothetical protein